MQPKTSFKTHYSLFIIRTKGESFSNRIRADYRTLGRQVDHAIPRAVPADVTGGMARCPFSLSRLVRITAECKVLYNAEKDHCQEYPEPASQDLYGGVSRNYQVYEPLDFLAELTQHIPNKGEHLIRYYGCYSNKSRGGDAEEWHVRCGQRCCAGSVRSCSGAGTARAARPAGARQARELGDKVDMDPDYREHLRREAPRPALALLPERMAAYDKVVEKYHLPKLR